MQKEIEGTLVFFVTFLLLVAFQLGGGAWALRWPMALGIPMA